MPLGFCFAQASPFAAIHQGRVAGLLKGNIEDCSGSMIPDTNVGGNIATINEVSDDQKATFFFS